MLLDLDHEVMQVDELRARGQAAERGLVQDLVEAVVVLDQLRQGALRRGGASSSEQEQQQGGGGGVGLQSPPTWMMLVPFLKLVNDLMTS